jgi:hypothetical protein
MARKEFFLEFADKITPHPTRHGASSLVGSGLWAPCVVACAAEHATATLAAAQMRRQQRFFREGNESHIRHRLVNLDEALGEYPIKYGNFGECL